jgi:hypothetical protein
MKYGLLVGGDGEVRMSMGDLIADVPPIPVTLTEHGRFLFRKMAPEEALAYALRKRLITPEVAVLCALQWFNDEPVEGGDA